MPKKDPRSQLPSEKQERLQKIKDQKDKALQEAEEQLHKDMAECYGTGAGQRVLKWHMDQLGWNVPPLGANPTTQEIDPQRTVYNAMRLSHYLQMRKYIPTKILRKVEDDE